MSNVYVTLGALALVILAGCQPSSNIVNTPTKLSAALDCSLVPNDLCIDPKLPPINLPPFYEGPLGLDLNERIVDIPDVTYGAPYDDSFTHIVLTDVIPGWQACTLKFQPSLKNDGSITVAADQFFVGDPQDPPRFKRYKVTLTAKGSTVIADRWGSSSGIKQVKLTIIKGSLGNDKRYYYGCDMPLQHTPETQKFVSHHE